MDLREKKTGSPRRHPWETARLAALKRILRLMVGDEVRTALDIGCGDGFISAELFEGSRIERLAAVDSNFSESDLITAAREHPGTEFHRRIDDVGGGPFDFILMLDVLEHIDSDTEYLRGTVEHQLKPGGHILITVPAFQLLFSGHDRFLRHFRRYDRKSLRSLVEDAGLEKIGDGYLFASLLPLRAVSLGAQKLMPWLAPKPTGIGGWRHGPLLTASADLMLRLDNRMLLSWGKRGLYIPGLTVWTLCKKPQS